MPDTSSGAVGELLAARFLREKGYEVGTSNYHSRFGEIDMIAYDDEYVVFVEVKTRRKGSMFTPREAVTAAKQRKIIKTALQFIKAYGLKLQPRFDVVEIVTTAEKPFKVLEIHHIVNAFEAGDLHLGF